MRVFKVIRTEHTVSEYLVEAKNRTEAIEIVNDMPELLAKEEVIGADYTAHKANDIKGRIVYTKDGYIDADKKRHIIK